MPQKIEQPQLQGVGQAVEQIHLDSEGMLIDFCSLDSLLTHIRSHFVSVVDVLIYLTPSILQRKMMFEASEATDCFLKS